MQKNPVLTIRENVGLTRREFSQRAGLTYQTVMTLEKGYNNSLRPETAQRIAKVTKCDPEKLQEDFKQWRQVLKQ
jgi:transcriptional regulator with XRE-family HTH domain